MVDQLSPTAARTPLSFEDFVEAATAAALRAATKVAAADPAKPGGAPADKFKLPWPIWIGLIINNRDFQGVEAQQTQK